MDDDQGPPVGSVAEEAARLLDALGGWASTASTSGYAPTPQADAPQSGSGGAIRCDRCGAENGAGQAIVCQLCPVCQGLGLLRSVHPEAVDRLADLAGAIAATLRDLAAQHRADATHGAGDQHGATTGAGGMGRTGRVQDIPVEDDEQGSAAP